MTEYFLFFSISLLRFLHLPNIRNTHVLIICNVGQLVFFLQRIDIHIFLFIPLISYYTNNIHWNKKLGIKQKEKSIPAFFDIIFLCSETNRKNNVDQGLVPSIVEEEKKIMNDSTHETTYHHMHFFIRTTFSFFIFLLARTRQ